MATTDKYSITGSLTPSKPCMRFYANATDGIQVDASAAAIVAGNHTIGTFCAWIMVPNKTGTYTIWGTGDADAVEYTHVTVEAGTIWVMMVKAGPTTEIDVNTAAGTITPHVWHHIAIVQDAVCMKVYIDGEEKALTWTTETNRAQWFADLNNIDGAHIGAADSVAGGAALSQEFNGYIADVRIWSGTTSASALTQYQIKQVMSGQTSVGSPLNYWTLNVDDGPVTDKGSGADNGTIAGALIYVDGSPFTSKLTFRAYVPIAATQVVTAVSNGTATACFFPSA